MGTVNLGNVTGPTGAAAHVYFKWAANGTPTDGQISDTPNDYIGVYSGTAATAPTTATSYTWFKYKGEVGPNSVTTSTATNITGWLKGNGSAVSGATPTASDVGALPSTGGEVSGVILLSNGIPLRGKTTGAAGRNLAYVASNDQVFIGDGALPLRLVSSDGGQLNGQSLYYAGNKPTAADVGASNRNLLHNWDFRNPVNQRAASSYSAAGYTIDRWTYAADTTLGTVTVNSGYLTITGTAAYLEQRLYNYLPYGTYTMSALYSDGIITSATFTVSSTITHPATEDSKGTYLMIWNQPATSGYKMVRIKQVASATINVVALKLELGSVSTLVNDPPANYVEQKLICQSVSDDGSTFIRGAGSNRNLLHNWDFQINQRGAASYTETFDYTVDRWIGKQLVVTPHASTVTIAARASTTDSFLLQYVENPQLYVGKRVTLSAKVKSITGQAWCYIIAYDGANYTTANAAAVSADGIISCSATLPATIQELHVRLNVTDGTGVATFESAKLELGSVSTLANDPPADYGKEAIKCLRFAEASDDQKILGAANAFLSLTIPFKVKKRIIPTQSFTDDANTSGKITLIKNDWSEEDNVTPSEVVVTQDYLQINHLLPTGYNGFKVNNIFNGADL